MDCGVSGGGTITSLQPVAHRYDNTGYTGSGGYWGGSCTAPATHNYNNYYNNTSQPPSTQGYPGHPPPAMMLPPLLYSTVNQSAIHVHLHPDGRSEYNHDVSSMVQNNVTISGAGSRAIEIGILQHNQLPGEDAARQQHNDPVWRPY